MVRKLVWVPVWVPVLLVSVLVLVGCGGCGAVGEQAVVTTDGGWSTTETVADPMVRVAVIDTGFSSRAIPQENMLPGQNYIQPQASTEDTFGHGTAMASVILRYAPEAVLVPLVSSAYDRGRLSQVEPEVLAGMIRDAVDVYHCRIINISAGMVADEACVAEAVAYAEEQGALIIAAAGNDYKEKGETPYYPAAYDTVLAVGALDGEAVADFSQRGEWVDVYAPGTDVTVLTISGNETTQTGTSCATARICAGAVALLRENSAYTPAQLRQLLLEQAKLLPEGGFGWQ